MNLLKKLRHWVKENQSLITQAESLPIEQSPLFPPGTALERILKEQPDVIFRLNARIMFLKNRISGHSHYFIKKKREKTKVLHSRRAAKRIRLAQSAD